MKRLGIRTELCDLLGIEYPIILAGMGGAAGPTLAAAVSEAGGLGVIGATGYTPDELADVIGELRRATSKPFGVDLLLPSTVAEAGNFEDLEAEIPEESVRFVEGLMREFSIPKPTRRLRRTPLTRDYFRRQVEVVLDLKVAVFASGLGNPAWMVEDAHAVGMKVIGLVGNVKNARRVADGGADVVVAQGHEAGGHTGRIGTMALVPQVVDAISPTLTVAAGGIADGRGLVAALALGAVGIWCGTAFIATPEAYVDSERAGYSDEWQVKLMKQKLLDATEEDFRIGRMYTGKTMRHVYNSWTAAWERAEAPATLRMPLQGMLVGEALEGAREAKIAELVGGPAGQIGGMVTELKPAAQIVREMVAQAEELLG
jgi:NAD(P)H-dependent flavin oxidoreductase YrpB (nitropropane dioxygenase family)